MTRPFSADCSAGMPEHPWEAGSTIRIKRSIHGLGAWTWSVGYTGEVASCHLMQSYAVAQYNLALLSAGSPANI